MKSSWERTALLILPATSSWISIAAILAASSPSREANELQLVFDAQGGNRGPAGAVPASMDPADAIYVVSPGRSVLEQDADSLHCSGRGVHWWRDVLHLQPVPNVNQAEGGTSGERDHVLLPGQETAPIGKHNNRHWHHNPPITVSPPCNRPRHETPHPP